MLFRALIARISFTLPGKFGGSSPSPPPPPPPPPPPAPTPMPDPEDVRVRTARKKKAASRQRVGRLQTILTGDAGSSDRLG